MTKKNFFWILDRCREVKSIFYRIHGTSWTCLYVQALSCPRLDMNNRPILSGFWTNVFLVEQTKATKGFALEGRIRKYEKWLAEWREEKRCPHP